MLMHLGLVTILQVFYGWRKVTQEFLKRLDPELLFYYHTSVHSRFYEGVMPNFHTKPGKKPIAKVHSEI